MKKTLLTYKAPSKKPLRLLSTKPLTVLVLALGTLALSSCATTHPIKPTATVMIGSHQSL